MKGLEMMLKSFGIDAEDIKKQFVDFIAKVNAYIKGDNERMERMEKTLAEISQKLDNAPLAITEKTGDPHDPNA